MSHQGHLLERGLVDDDGAVDQGHHHHHTFKPKSKSRITFYFVIIYETKNSILRNKFTSSFF